MRADFDQEKKRAVNVATRSLERDLERLKADHTSETEEMMEKHREQLSQNKKKQWVRKPDIVHLDWVIFVQYYTTMGIRHFALH